MGWTTFTYFASRSLASGVAMFLASVPFATISLDNDDTSSTPAGSAYYYTISLVSHAPTVAALTGLRTKSAEGGTEEQVQVGSLDWTRRFPLASASGA
jgi:hypothetical protein